MVVLSDKVVIPTPTNLLIILMTAMDPWTYIYNRLMLISIEGSFYIWEWDKGRGLNQKKSAIMVKNAIPILTK